MSTGAPETPCPDDRAFWEDTARDFPSLAGAPSTLFYRECEIGLFRRFVPDLAGKAVFKSDLWDEAKNTRILRWAADRGARVYGLDISLPMVAQARRAFAGTRPRPGLIASDLRAAGFRPRSFDVVYSMGTIEHFPEYREAVVEMARLLKPGGLAIVGVPNRHDVFLRPLLVRFLGALGLYAYGDERPFSMRELEGVVRGAGLEIVDRTGILFIPGWLRMLDLFLYVRRAGWRRLTAPLVAPFAWLSRRSALLRRQGYLIVCVARRPGPGAEERRRG